MAFATNAVITSNVMLARPENKRVVDIICDSSRPVLIWHTEQYKKLRSSDASEKWLLHQLAGGLLKHVEDILFAVEDQSVLKVCGFQTLAGCADALHDADILAEDELATLLGQHCLLLASCRLRRTLHTTRGWPVRLYSLLCDDERIGDEAYDDFLFDCKLFEILQRMPARGEVCSKMYERHLCKGVSSLQLELAFADVGVARHPDVLALIRQRVRLPMQTVVAEDVIGCQKNTVFSTAQKKFKKPEASMAAVLRAETFTKKHSYTTVEPDLPLGMKTGVLSSAHFQGSARTRTLDFDRIVWTAPTAPWFSLGPGNHMLPVADLAALRDAYRCDGNFAAVEHAWVGELVAVKHMLIVQILGFIDGDNWLFGLDHYSESAAQGWPCKLKKVAGYDAYYCELKAALKLPELVTIFNVEDVFARPVAWQSWARQRRSFTSDAAKEQLKAPAVRCFVTGPRETLLVCSARKAFWGLKLTSRC